MRHPMVNPASLCAALLVAVLSGQAAATMLVGEPRPTSKERGPQQVPKSIPVAPTLDLASAVVVAVDKAKNTLTVTGKTVALHPRLKVVTPNGSLTSIAALRPGTKIRFALEPIAPAITAAPATAAAPSSSERKVVLIYIE
jgi:hypothetical protein